MAVPLLLLREWGFGLWLATAGLGLYGCVRLLGAGAREAAVLCVIGSLLATVALCAMPRAASDARSAFRAIAIAKPEIAIP